MAEARETLHRLEDERKRGAYDVDSGKLTVDNLLDRYLESRRLEKQMTTFAWYKRNFATHVRPAIGHIRLRALEEHHIVDMLANLRCARGARKGKPLAGSSSRNVLVGITAALEFARKRKWVFENAADLIGAPNEGHVERVTLHKDETDIFLSAIKGTELEAIAAFLLFSGVRRSEACAMRWKDVDLVDETYHIERSAANLRAADVLISPNSLEIIREGSDTHGRVVIKDTKTKRSRRWEALTAEAVDVLQTHRMKQIERHLALGIAGRDESEQFIFDRLDGSAWDPNELSRKFSRLVRKGEMPKLRLHDLRHTFAMWYLASGATIHGTSEVLGHSGTGITERTYAFGMMEEKKARARRFSERLKRPGKNATPLKAVG